MAKLDLPYVIWRDGRPRFQPSSRERRLGFKNKDLKHDDGRWFSYEETKAFADAELIRIRAARESGRKIKPEKSPLRTVEALLRDWRAELEKKVTRGDITATTRDGYLKCVTAILFKPEPRDAARKRMRAIKLRQAEAARDYETMAHISVDAIEPPEAKAFVDYLIDARGRAMGRACRAALVQAFEFGRLDTGWRVKSNPFGGLRFKKPAGRIVIYTDAEIRALIEAADYSGRASVGDSVLLGVFTGQRQGDRLALEDQGLQDGRRLFRQSKTGAIVAIPETPRLAQRLAEAKIRVTAVKLAIGTRPVEIIVSEATGLGYNSSTYRHVFDDVRTLAAERSGLTSLLDKHDADLRDTAVTWLARAGATIPEICSITGHDPQSVYTILRHYLAITPELADAAIGKLVTWMDAKGMTV